MIPETVIQHLMEEIREHLYQSNRVYRQIPGGFLVSVEDPFEGKAIEITVKLSDQIVDWEK